MPQTPFIPLPADVQAILQYMSGLQSGGADAAAVSYPLIQALYDRNWIEEFNWSHWIATDGRIYLQDDSSAASLIKASWP